MNALEQELKELIISSLELEDIQPADIESTAALFGEGLGLDSIDALELGLAIKKKYNVRLDAESAETKKHFYSVQSLATMIAATRSN
jgi:acyl carrier protein